MKGLTQSGDLSQHIYYVCYGYLCILSTPFGCYVKGLYWGLLKIPNSGCFSLSAFVSDLFADPVDGRNIPRMLSEFLGLSYYVNESTTLYLVINLCKW